MEYRGNNAVSIFEVSDALKELGIDVYHLNVNNPFSKLPEVLIKGFFSGRKEREESENTPKNIFKNGLYTTVMWSDGTLTIVKRGEDEPDDEYNAFTAALAKKLYGSTSAVKRIAGMTKVQSKKYKESADCAEKDACEIAVEKKNSLGLTKEEMQKVLYEIKQMETDTKDESLATGLNDLARKQWEDYLKGEKG